jgi:hypothetical protein
MQVSCCKVLSELELRVVVETRARCNGYKSRELKNRATRTRMRTRSDLYITSLDVYPQCASHRSPGRGIEGLASIRWAKEP